MTRKNLQFGNGTQKMTKEQLDFLEKDLNLIIKDNFHPKHLDLMQITIKEDVLELIKFVKKIHNVLEIKATREDFNGYYSLGYLDGILQIKREIYENS